MSILPSDVSPSTDDELEFSEYCLVNSIQRNLATLLDRVVVDRHVETTVQRRVCLVNITTRYQLENIKTEISDLETVKKYSRIKHKIVKDTHHLKNK